MSATSIFLGSTLVEPGEVFQMSIRCKGEESLIKLLSKLEIIVVMAVIYEYGSTKSLIGKEECDAMVVSTTRKV